MGYEKLNLPNGTRFTSEHLQHIEDGISEIDKSYVKKTDIATPYEAGVVKVNASGGISINPDNDTIYIAYSSESEIDGRTSIRPIVPANLEYAVNSVVGKQIGDIDTALDNIIAIQNNYIYGYMSASEGGDA